MVLVHQLLICLCFLGVLSFHSSNLHSFDSENDFGLKAKSFSNTWSVKVTGGLQKANELADKNGLVCKGQIGSLEDWYLFEMTDGVMKEMPEVKKKLMETDIGDDKVLFVEQQKFSHHVPKLNN